jgi:translation initiation factor 2B subunit (eIF-2B alpha/beta/delta family)
MQAQSGSLEEYRSELSDVSVKVLDAQPVMASLVTLVRDVLASVEASADLETARHAAVRTAEAFGSGLELRAESVATRAAALIPSGGTVATISSSSTVQTTLTHEGARAIGQVICFESRPMREGKILATALAKAGVTVTFAVDAAASTLLGADSIGDLGVVNKIGSAGLVDAAMRHEVPVMVVCDETKILPTGFPQHLADDRSPEEVWRAPAGVRVWNRYFEPFELERVTVVVTESAALTPLEVEELRKGIVLPPGLRAWADARARRTP